MSSASCPLTQPQVYLEDKSDLIPSQGFNSHRLYIENIHACIMGSLPS